VSKFLDISQQNDEQFLNEERQRRQKRLERKQKDRVRDWYENDELIFDLEPKKQRRKGKRQHHINSRAVGEEVMLKLDEYLRHRKRNDWYDDRDE